MEFYPTTSDDSRRNRSQFAARPCCSRHVQSLSDIARITLSRRKLAFSPLLKMQFPVLEGWQPSSCLLKFLDAPIFFLRPVVKPFSFVIPFLSFI